ncbi:sigma-54-dependent Fis family transcriptional regulator [Fictibacillus fluitans]|uniref:Sigma-54-dependent Fis family transcriptional regulator n=1 Tax=Fictibacillus fluitans TaxID=3058422 RepID=A0ABT8HQ95_9BACL|nr:sigma-54-dependent Fis family transcriptional regulator [Fictibacillus sp. NE201]MDN4522937.1 sigma-54-dependent Fis family transcriptional regulator [Fictibacillus sp. NE201]
MLASTCYLSTWKRFVQEGVLDPARLNKRIQESWHRCKDVEVDPYLTKGRHILSEEELILRKNKNSTFLEAAGPHMQRMKEAFQELGMMALLIDSDGYVLSLNGNRKIITAASRINFVEGVKWTEDEVGTNAIGTALQTKEAVLVSGTEHYSIASHQWSCSAVPVHDPEGSILGVLDISCPVSTAHPYMLGMIASVSQAIEQELKIQSSQREMELIRQCMDLLEMNPNLVVCSPNGNILAMGQALRRRSSDLAGRNIAEAVHYGLMTEKQMPIYNAQKRILGYCVSLVSDKQYSSWQGAMPAAEPGFVFPGEAGKSRSFQQTIEEIRRVAPSSLSVYISGETGTGKELVARAIHENSPRKNGPFIAVNCGALSAELLESELFGYEPGAFTGAKKQGAEGKFRQADGGTIFLDEIGEIPQAMQVALLRVLQEKKVMPVGSAREIPADFRVICATHQDLGHLVQQGLFRKDLFYRLHVYPLAVPALRERKEDIPHLIRYYCENQGMVLNLPDHVMDILVAYDWPGNIRELFNVMERLHVIPEASMNKGELNQLLRPLEPQETGCLPFEDKTVLTFRDQVEKDVIMDALKKTKGNVTLAAKLCEIPRSTFYKKIHKYGL